MKAYLALISAAVIGLAACSQEAAKPAEAPAASAASEAAPAETTAPADAAPCFLKQLRPTLPLLLLPATARLLLKPMTLCSSTLKKSK